MTWKCRNIEKNCKIGSWNFFQKIFPIHNQDYYITEQRNRYRDFMFLFSITFYPLNPFEPFSLMYETFWTKDLEIFILLYRRKDGLYMKIGRKSGKFSWFYCLEPPPFMIFLNGKSMTGFGSFGPNGLIKLYEHARRKLLQYRKSWK